MRKQGSCLEKEIMQRTMSGARKQGRPRTAWMVNINTRTGLPVEESIRMTEDRDKWRKYVHGVDTGQLSDPGRLKNRRSTFVFTRNQQYKTLSYVILSYVNVMLSYLILLSIIMTSCYSYVMGWNGRARLWCETRLCFVTICICFVSGRFQRFSLRGCATILQAITLTIYYWYHHRFVILKTLTYLWLDVAINFENRTVYWLVPIMILIV